MSDTATFLLMIRPLPEQGEAILAENWTRFLNFLEEQVVMDGKVISPRPDGLLAFSFPASTTFFESFIAAIHLVRDEFTWDSSRGALPIQIVFDLIPDAESIPPLQPLAQFWTYLQAETIYITPELHRRWELLQAGEDKFADHTLAQDGSGLYQLIFMDYEIGKYNMLLASRALPVSGEGKACFYCGMRNHHPSDCPSKLLSMDTWGLDDVGYLPFAGINDLYMKVFPAWEKVVAKIKDGFDSVDLREEKYLLVFVAYFDLWAVFQPRFLWNFAFSAASSWDGLYQTSRSTLPNQNLRIAFDCLRVRQYEQAEKLLEKETLRVDGKGNVFAAYIGKAFWCLEQDRLKDMELYLKQAKTVAKKITEEIYAALLISRYYELKGDLWSAGEIIAEALKVDYDCLDLQYRRIQLAVREGLTEQGLKQIQSLVTGQRDIFIRAFLDPLLMPIQGVIEKISAREYKAVEDEAQRNFGRAQKEFEAFEVWLSEDDSLREENRATIEKLAQQLERKSYFDLLDIAELSNGIYFSCSRQRNELANDLYRKLERREVLLNSYLAFWESYPYKSLFRKFGETLSNAIKKNKRALALIGENDRESTILVIQFDKDISRNLKLLTKEKGRLLAFKNLLHALVTFAKKLVICEASLLPLVLVAFPVISVAFSDVDSLVLLVELAANPMVKEKLLMLTATVFAPFVALVWSTIELQKE